MKKTLLLEILNITKRQNELIKEKEIDAFGELLEQRQQLMDKLDTLHEQHPQYKEEKHLELLQEIIVLDKENTKLYHEEFEDVKQKLNEIRARKRVNNVYTNPYTIANEEGIFFDKGR